MTTIVAEIGVNWNGDFELVREMVAYAKNCGCDAVKFQSFNEENVKDHPEKSKLLKSSISKSNIESINSISKEIGIEWFCTPMYEDAVDLLEPFVEKYKIREFDARLILKNSMTPLIKKILDTDKEIIASTSYLPINLNPVFSNVRWLYCIPKYPCALSDLNFSNLTNFYGYSNHCDDIIAPLTASILGANLIEIHITSDKTKDFFDNNVSFDYSELTQLMKYIRTSSQIKHD
jgi:sialic acid synthase SpsE